METVEEGTHHRKNAMQLEYNATNLDGEISMPVFATQNLKWVNQSYMN